MFPACLPGTLTLALPWQITGVIRSLWPPGAAGFHMGFQWFCLGKLPESSGAKRAKKDSYSFVIVQDVPLGNISFWG